MRSWRSGTAQLKIRGQELVRIPVFLPSLQEQTQILSRFQIVYNKLFQSEVIYNDFLLNLMKKYLESGDLLFLKYRDSQIKISDHFRLINGKTPLTDNPEYYKNGTIKWINGGVLTNLYFLTDVTLASKLVTEKAVQECQLSYAWENSVLISNINLDSGKIVWVSCNQSHKEKEQFTFNQQVVNFSSTSNNSSATLFFALRQINFLAYTSGSFSFSTSNSTLSNMKINWVSKPEKQKIFFAILNSKLAQIKDLHSKIKDLHSKIKDLHSKIKDLLLLKYLK